MKILVVNRPWFIPALKKLGHKTLFLTQSLDKLSKKYNLEKNFDLILIFGCSTENRWWEWIEEKKSGIFNNLKIKKVYWEMEAGEKVGEKFECRYNWTQEKGYKFDIILWTNPDYMKYYNHPNQYWMPHAFDSKIWKPYNFGEKINKYNNLGKWIDVGFIGNKTERFAKEFIRLLRKKPSIKLYKGLGDYRMVNLCKIVCNKGSVTYKSNDLNCRPFEILGCKRFLLTNALPRQGQNILFKNKKHLVEFNNEGEFVDLALYYLKHEKEREKIARQGYEHVMRHHTYLHRVRDIMNLIQKNKVKWKWPPVYIKNI